MVLLGRAAVLDPAPSARDALVTGMARMTRQPLAPMDVSQKCKVPLIIHPDPAVLLGTI